MAELYVAVVGFPDLSCHIADSIHGLEERLTTGDAEITAVDPSYSYPATNRVAQRCQQCTEPVSPRERHAIAIVQYTSDVTGERTAAFLTFCGPTCLDQCVQGLSDDDR